MVTKPWGSWNGPLEPKEVLSPGKMVQAKSFKVSVLAENETDWADNGLRFFVLQDAEEYGANLKRRWTLLKRYVVVPTEDNPNCVYPNPSDRYHVKRSVPLGGNGKETA